MKADKWVYGILAGIAAFFIYYYGLQRLGFKDDKSLSYFKNLYNYTIGVALLAGRVVYLHFKNKEGKKNP